MGDASVRRLTTTELVNSLFDNLGVAFEPEDVGFPSESPVDGFDNNTGASNVSQFRADRLFDVAEDVSTTATSDLSLLLPCEPDAVTKKCINDFVSALGLKMFRRPLTPEEQRIFVDLYDSRVEEDGTPTAVSLIVQTMIMSPQFIFRFERGIQSPDPDFPSRIQLTEYELATRMSYFLWASGPDDDLLRAVKDNKLVALDGRRAEAQRMLDDPKAHRGVAHFTSQWGNLRGLDNPDLDRDPNAFPDFDTELVTHMRTETETFLERTVWERGGGLTEFLTSKDSYISGRLAELYDMNLGLGPDDWIWTSLPATRQGFLTQSSFLTQFSHAADPSPVQRGLFIRNRLLCQDVPPPPPNVATELGPPEEATTNRERLSVHVREECYGCHKLMDDIGLGFEHFDAIGAFREKDGGKEVVATGELFSTKDIDGPFDMANELIDKLVSSEEVQSCFVANVFQYAYGRRPTREEQCIVQTLNQSSPERSLLTLMLEMVMTDSFGYRPVPTEKL